MSSTDRIATSAVAPQRFRPVAAAWRVVDYAFLRWTVDRSLPPEAALFRYHQASTTLVLYWAVLGSAVLELPVLHLIVRHWSHRVAWILSALGLAAIVYIVALIKGLYLRPVVLTDRHLLIRLGIQSELSIPLQQVISIQGAGAAGPDVIRMYKADAPNVRVTFEQAGRAAAVGFFLSEPEKFLSAYASRRLSPIPEA